MRTAVVILFLGVVVGAYLFYVRGMGVQPATSAPQTIERQDVARTYAWTQKAEMPTPRTEVSASVLRGKVYVIGGFDGSARTLATVEVYDPATDSWHSGPDLPEARHHAALEDTLYVIGGFAGPGLEPQADVFALKAQTKWQRLTPLPEARGALAAAVLDDRILVVGGIGPLGLASDLFAYEPAADSWTKKTPAPTRRDYLAAGALRGLFYVAGGRERSLSRNLAALESYDPIKDTWRTEPRLPTARGGAA
ncbi:MAG: Kelch repeat-containing protein, partial [Gammaproteobacteria bacterium]